VHITKYKKELKKVKFTLEQDLKAQTESRGTGILLLQTRPYVGVGWSTRHPGLVIPGKDLVLIA
jgi:hypothetical protein